MEKETLYSHIYIITRYLDDDRTVRDKYKKMTKFSDRKEPYLAESKDVVYHGTVVQEFEVVRVKQ